MPFQSEKQRRFLHANHPEIAQRWEKEYANGGISNHFRKKFDQGSDYGQFARRQAHNIAAGSQAMNVGGGNGGGGGPPVILNPPPSGPSPAEIAAAKAKAEAEKRALEAAAKKKHLIDFKDRQKKKVKLRSKFDTGEGWDTEDSGIGFKMSDLGDQFSTDDNIKLAKVYNKKDLEGIDADWAGMGFGANDKLEAMENLYEGVKKMKNTPLGSTLTLNEAKEKVQALGEIPFSGYKSVDIDLVPTDFLETETDLKKQTSPYKLFDKAKGGVARKNYFHGGILDINESEEIISDDGNDIELTAYNAEFDDPNDLSTGVKSLFMKKGGNVRLGPHTATDLLAKKNPDGTRSKYQPPGHKDAVASTGSDKGHSRFEPGSGYYGETVTKAPATTGDGYQDRIIEIAERKRKEDLKDMIERGPGSDVEKYDTDLVGMSDAEKFNARRNMIKSKYTATSSQRKNNLTTNYNNERDRLQKELRNSLLVKGLMLVMGMPVGIKDFVSVDWKNKSLKGPLKTAMTLDQLKKTHIADLEDMKDSLLADVDINNPNEMVNLDDTVFPDLMKDLKDLYKKPEEDDPENNETPVLPKVVPIGEEIDAYARGPHYKTPWEKIKANQARKAMLLEKEIHTEYNPIVGESVTDITMQANKGGLANLFRVKNQ
jgi:hypothetical protein